MAARRRGLHPRGDRRPDGQDRKLFQVAAGAGARAAAAHAGDRRSGTVMHCTMDDLLALRANEGSAWARRHLDECPACQTELEALYQRVARLKALPPLGPARDRWPAIRDAIVAERRRRVRSEEHTSELQSQSNLVCRLLLEKKKKKKNTHGVRLSE